MVPRFLQFSGEEIQKLAEKALNKNSVKPTKTWMNVWKSLAKSEGLNDDILSSTKLKN